MTTDRALRILLRLIGILCLPSVVAAFMPHEWLAWAVGQVEPQTPVSVLVEYLARFLAMFYFLLGVLMLLCASNVERYAAIIYAILGWIAVCWAAFIAGSIPHGTVLWQSLMYRFILADVVAGAVTAAAIFVLMLRIRKTPGSSVPRQGSSCP
ncbi:MAG: hypothetical protein ACE15C_04855 [Phycisphaerae bacterium]